MVRRQMVRRLSLTGGVVGPATFIGSWAWLGSRLDGYAPWSDPISRLAAVGAATRPAMTAGMAAFGVGAMALATELRRREALPSPWPLAGWLPVGLCGAATVGVAALPLNAGIDDAHLVAALLAYVTLAAAPALAAIRPRRAGAASDSTWRATSLIASLVVAGALGISVATQPTGVFQRIGLTSGDVWVMALAVRNLRW